MKLSLLFAIIPFFLFQSCSSNEVGENDEDRRLLQQQEREEDARAYKLSHLIKVSDSLYSSNKVNESIKFLDSALLFAKGESGKLKFKKANYLFDERDFGLAAEVYVESAEEGFKRDTAFYLAALCYEKVRNRQEAVDNLRKAITLGHEEADKLHEKINPERVRVSGYNIRCCDGSISYSTSRRGTCSHHGGVCNWREPVYENYREY